MVSWLRRRVLGPPALVTAQDGEVVVEVGGAAVHRFPLAQVIGAYFDEDQIIITERSRRRLEIGCASGEEAERVLRGLGLSAEERALTVELGSAASQVSCGELFAVIGLVLLAPFAAMALAVLVAAVAYSKLPPPSGLMAGFAIMTAAVALRRALQVREATIGTDGVVIHGAIFRSFIPFDSVKAIRSDDFGVVLVRDQGDVRLPFRRRDKTFKAPWSGAEIERRKLLITRLEAVIAARTAASSDFDPACLDRAGRSLSEWTRALVALCDTSDYRRVGLAPETLVELAADPHQSAERRVAAAIAVSPLPEHAARIRALAAGAADPLLAGLLDEAAAGRVALGHLERAGARHPGQKLRIERLEESPTSDADAGADAAADAGSDDAAAPEDHARS